MKSKLLFHKGENQSWHPCLDTCFDCGKGLVGRGTKVMDRERISTAYPFGVYLCKRCARRLGMKVYIPWTERG